MRISMPIVLFSFCLLLNVAFWFGVRSYQATWANVPPAPDQTYAASYGLGDRAFAYRLNSLMLQNLGETGGRTTRFDDYDYGMLAKWFSLQDSLDPHSDYVPYLASFYFGAVENPGKLRFVVSYLKEVGTRAEGEKWRWLVQAVFLARWKINDLNYALSLANLFVQINNPDMPEWVRQMPAFILGAKGEKEAAYALVVETLKSRGDRMSPEEAVNMRYYACHQLLDPAEASLNPLCKDI